MEALTAYLEQIDNDEISSAPATIAAPEFVAVANSDAARAAFAEFYVDEESIVEPYAATATFGDVAPHVRARMLANKISDAWCHLDDAFLCGRFDDCAVLRRGILGLLAELHACVGNARFQCGRVQQVLTRHQEILTEARQTKRISEAMDYADRWLRDALQYDDAQADYLRAIRDGKAAITTARTITVLRGNARQCAAVSGVNLKGASK